MKTNLGLCFALMCVCVCACASTSKQAVSNSGTLVYIDPDENKPPTDFEFTVKDRVINEHPATTDPFDRSYDESIRGINNIFTNESQQYSECIANSKINSNDPSCKRMLKDFCSIDMLLDTHGHGHMKPYCKSKNTTSKYRTFNNP